MGPGPGHLGEFFSARRRRRRRRRRPWSLGGTNLLPTYLPTNLLPTYLPTNLHA